MAILILLVVIIILIAWVIITTNNFKKLKLKIEESLSGIEVSLTKRYDMLRKRVMLLSNI